MPRSSSNRSTNVATGARAQTPGSADASDPTHGERRANIGGPASQRPRSAAQTYLRWANFVTGSAESNFGFGGYFADDGKPCGWPRS